MDNEFKSKSTTEYSEYLTDIKESNNVLYNIINYQEPQTIFWYGFILIIFIFVSSKIEFNYSILIGLIFYSILIYYLYTDKKINYIDSFEKLSTKYDMINTNNNILKQYPVIIDLLFYMREFKSYSIEIYNRIVIQFENFIILYESCLKDMELISKNYLSMETIKYQILYIIDSYNYNTNNYNYSDKIYKIKKRVEQILNVFLKEIYIMQDKKIYYNGLTNNSNIIDKNAILSVNYFDSYNEYIRNTKSYDIQNYLIL
jgi:hypothetical protein